MTEWKECGVKWQVEQEDILQETKKSKKKSKKNKSKKINSIAEDDLMKNQENIPKKGLKFFGQNPNGEAMQISD